MSWGFSFALKAESRYPSTGSEFKLESNRGLPADPSGPIFTIITTLFLMKKFVGYGVGPCYANGCPPLGITSYL